LGDLRLKQEQSVKFSTSLQKKTAKFYLEITPFLNRISNYMYLTPIGLENTIRGSFPVWEYQQTKAVLTGIDMTTHWNWSENWFQNFELAYVNGQDMSKNLPIIEIPPLHLNTKIQYSNAKWHHLLLSLKADMVFTQSRFPNNDFFTNIVVEGNLEPRLVKISTPPPAYELLHFYSEMKFKTFKKSWTTLVFSVQNIFNTEYRDYLNKQRFFANEMGRNLQIQLKINY
jgi:iron complex outermembrane recepter protein